MDHFQNRKFKLKKLNPLVIFTLTKVKKQQNSDRKEKKIEQCFIAVDQLHSRKLFQSVLTSFFFFFY